MAKETMARIRISPYARKTAQELGVDIAAVFGTGPDGRIIWRDIDAAAKNRPASGAAGCMAEGLYTHADLTEARRLLAALPAGTMTLEALAEKAAAGCGADLRLVLPGPGAEGVLPALREGETAVLGVGLEGERAALYLAYSPAALGMERASACLGRIRAVLENPYLLVV